MWEAPPQFHSHELNPTGAKALPFSSSRCLNPYLMCSAVHRKKIPYFTGPCHRGATTHKYDVCSLVIRCAETRNRVEYILELWHLYRTGTNTHTCGPLGTRTTFKSQESAAMWVMVHYVGGGKKSPSWKPGTSGGYVTCVINTANAKPSSKEGYTGSHSNGVFVPSVQNITEVLNRGPSMDGRVLSPANTVGLPPWGQESERVNIAFTSKQRGGWSAFTGTWLFGWSISSAELYAARVIVLVCHYNTKVIPPYYGFSWRFAYAALNSRSDDRYRGVLLFIVGPLRSGSLITTAAASGALL